jgi:intein/homing endonuclease
MNTFDIKRRSRKEARNLAIGLGKIEFSIQDIWGNEKIVGHGLEIDRKFFSEWSDDFAYVLGLIFTDGNLIKQTYNRKRNQLLDTYAISITQKDPYILGTIRQTIFLNKPIRRIKNNVDSFSHILDFKDKEIYERLESLGLCPNKSLTVQFPEIPAKYLNGFIRGLFDGDGSYYGHHARLTTGSEQFAFGLKSVLKTAGFESTITVTPPGGRRNNPSYTVRVSTAGSNFERFYLFLYTGAKLFIPQKRETFESGLRGTNLHISALKEIANGGEKTSEEE